MNGKYKYLFMNTGLLMIGNFSSKILVFLLVPFYTSILSTAEYGSYDLIYSSVQLFFPVLSLNIIDGVMRFSINAGKDGKKDIFTTGVKYTLISFLLLSLITFVSVYLFHIEILQEYWIEFIVLYMGYAGNSLVLQFAKGLEDVKGISIAGVLGTLVMIGGNLLFLLVVKIGLRGYFYAYILSFFVPAIYLCFRDRMLSFVDRNIFLLKPRVNEKEMILYAVPLIFNTLSWNINNVADRYAVTYFCGIDVNGVYSVAYKIPAILNAVQVIFIQAWQISAIKEFGNEKGEVFYRSIYNGCQTVMVFLCSGLIIGTRILAKILFAKDFYDAWMYVPALLIYIVFNTLSGTVGGIFGAAKDTSSIAITAIVGALANIILNIALVYILGAEGAAIATVLSSVVIWRMRIHYSKKYVDMHIDTKKHCLEYLILLIQAAAMTAIQTGQAYVIQAALFFMLILLNYKEIEKMLFKAVGYFNSESGE